MVITENFKIMIQQKYVSVSICDRLGTGTT